MHELSVAMSIIDSVEEESARHEGQVTAVHMRLGPLSGLIKDALVSAFDLACEGTELAGVRLLIEDVPILAYCPNCQASRPVASMQLFQCPECESPLSDVLQGKELEIVALELQ